MKISVRKEEGETVVEFAGAFGEDLDAALEKLQRKLKVDPIAFDMSGITSVNSFGIRSWTNFLAHELDGRAYKFRRCGPAITEYFQLLPGKMHAERIESLDFAYRCNQCRHEFEGTFPMAEVTKASDLEQASCVACGGIATAILDPEDHLAFLENRF